MPETEVDPRMTSSLAPRTVSVQVRSTGSDGLNCCITPGSCNTRRPSSGVSGQRVNSTDGMFVDWKYRIGSFDDEYTAAELYPGRASDTDGVGAPVVNVNWSPPIAWP